jgi:hypothetical protein
MDCKAKDYKNILEIAKKKKLKFLEQFLKNEKCLIYYEKIKVSKKSSAFVYQVF